MILIKRIPELSIRNKKGKKINYGLFYCPYCKKDVIKPIKNGTRSESCECVWHKLSGERGRIHGDTKTRLYSIHRCMNRRCYDKNFYEYYNYGGRGIKVCEKWLKYVNFKEWALNNGYKNNLTIDRIDGNDNYYPENCRWITRSENSRYKRSTKLTLEIANEIRRLYTTGNYTQKEIGVLFDIKREHVKDIVNYYIWK